MFQSKLLYTVLAATFLLSACATSPYKGPVQGWVSKPAGDGPFPAVVLLSHCGGAFSFNLSYHWPVYLNSLGYVVMNVDSYTPRGATRCWELERNSRRDWQIGDAYHALDHLAGLPSVDGNRIGVMGFSDGAFAIYQFMIPRSSRSTKGLEFKAAISLYGGCFWHLVHSKDDIPLMLIIAEKDENLAPSCIEAARENSTIEAHVLKGAHHAFDSDRGPVIRYDSGGNAMLYSGEATNKARELTKTFFAKNLRK